MSDIQTYLVVNIGIIQAKLGIKILNGVCSMRIPYLKWDKAKCNSRLTHRYVIVKNPIIIERIKKMVELDNTWLPDEQFGYADLLNFIEENHEKL